MTVDPFSTLGIPRDSSETVIRQAWREKMRTSHPDTGGSHEQSIIFNNALRDALFTVKSALPSEEHRDTHGVRTRKYTRDTSSFTIDVLPVECWHVLEIVANQSGSVLVDEPPYLLEFTLHDSGLEDSIDAWCRCEMVPEAGATTVHITIGATQLHAPDIDSVRDYLIASLNELEWSD